jgi:hypothetical protein
MSKVARFLERNRDLDKATSQRAKEFLKTNTLSDLRFARIYNDGTCLTGCTEPGIQHFLFEREIALVAPMVVPVNSFHYSVLPKKSEHLQVFKHYKSYFKILSIFDLVHRTEEYTDIYALYSKRRCEDAAGQIMNASEHIRNYLTEFSREITREHKKTRIYLAWWLVIG